MTYPSVTQILPPPDFSKIPEHVLTFATERGTKVHQIVAAIAQRLWVPSIPEECQGYVESFRRWFDTYVEEVIYTEQELIDPVYGFMGHVDLVVRMLKEIVLIDIKTPVMLQKSWQLQLAGYLHLARKNGCKVKKAGSLQLSPQGKVPKMKWYQDSAQDLNVFLGLLNGWKFLNS